MGGTCNCVTDTSNNDTLMFSKENNSFSTRNEKNEKLRNINNSNINDQRCQEISQEFFNILNSIRINPDKYIRDSKDFSLFEIFIKLKKCPELISSENNNNNIINYLVNSEFEGKNCVEQESELKLLINDGNIKDISLFQICLKSDDVRENVWSFLLENEDDLGKIFSDAFSHLMIISFPSENKKKILTNLIFYKI